MNESTSAEAKQRSEVEGEKGKTFASTGEGNYSENVTNILLAQPLNPLVKLSFSIQPRSNIV